jgi:hypothetical protein
VQLRRAYTKIVELEERLNDELKDIGAIARSTLSQRLILFKMLEG